MLETRALDELLPGWQEGEAPPRTLAARDRFYLLTKRWALRLPTPPQMKNKKKKNQIVSLRCTCLLLALSAPAGMALQHDLILYMARAGI